MKLIVRAVYAAVGWAMTALFYTWLVLYACMLFAAAVPFVILTLAFYSLGILVITLGNWAYDEENRDLWFWFSEVGRDDSPW